MVVKIGENEENGFSAEASALLIAVKMRSVLGQP
jgi:hypothetical protein